MSNNFYMMDTVMCMQTGLVFSVEEFSTFNGPGIRATVFLKGCPLRCAWCHNPEGQTFDNPILRSPNGCTGCGACRRAAKTADGKTVFTPESIRQCPNGLLRYAATEYTVDGLCERLTPLMPMLRPDGGVTFSGGEPLAQPDFLLGCLRKLRGQTHRALQTAGYAEEDVFRAVLRETDYVLYDLKLMDDAAHRRYTGVSNAPILRNFAVLCGAGVPFVVRTPLIPTITDTPENLAAIAAFLRQNGMDEIELLPYNRLTGSKYPLAGRQYTPPFDEAVPPSPRHEIFASCGIRSRVR